MSAMNVIDWARDPSFPHLLARAWMFTVADAQKSEMRCRSERIKRFQLKTVNHNNIDRETPAWLLVEFGEPIEAGVQTFASRR